MSDLLVGKKLYVALNVVDRRTGEVLQPADDANIAWESSNEKVATVDGNDSGATITAVSPGNATIEAAFRADLGEGSKDERAGYVVTVVSQYNKTGAWLEPASPE